MKNINLKFIILILLGFALTGLHAQTNNFNGSRGTFTDLRDGNVYKWVKIGSQIWMAENLKILPRVCDKNEYTDKYFCFYVYGYNGENVSLAKQTTNFQTYGVLYNWKAAMYGHKNTNKNTRVQGICPNGWHLPNDSEWSKLINYLGGDTVAGNKLKEIGNSHWKYQKNVKATNSSGFTALPGGESMPEGYFCEFQFMGMFGLWWSSTFDYSEYNGGSSMLISFENSKTLLALIPKSEGLSVRCVKN